MIDNTSKILSKLNVLGIYQIVGGAIGVSLILWGMLNSEQILGPVIVIYLFMLLFFAFSGYCGILCLRNDKNALRLSLINQILQVIGFAMAGFAFQYAAGAYLIVGLDLTDSFNFIFGFGFSKFDFNINNESQRMEVHLNFIALALIIFIEKIKKQLKEEQDKDQISSLTST